MSNRTLTEVYAAFLLVIIIIILATVNWYNVPKLVEYMSFASSIASIILAVLAIAYSVLSSSSMDRNLGALAASVSQIQTATTGNQQLYHQLREDLKGSSGVFESGLKSVSTQIQGLSAFRDTGYSASHTDDGKKADEKSDDPDLLVSLINSSSVSGIMLLYVCVSCYKKKTMLTLSDLAEIIPSDVNYLHGYIIASTASGAINIIAPSPKKPTAVHRIAGDADKALAACQDRIKDFFDRPTTRPKDVEVLNLAMENLKQYIETGSLPPRLTPEDNNTD